MPRKARCKSSTGVYHVIIRGADRRVIFSDDEDNLRFLKVLFQVKKETDFINVIRYICQNPVKADICHNPFEYPWTGCYKILDKYELLDSFDEYYLMGKEK